MTQDGNRPSKKNFVPPSRPAPELPPSESGTLSGFTRQQADLASAADLFETIKTARQKAAESARGDAAQMAIDHAMATPVSALQQFLQNKRALYGLIAVILTAVVFAIVSSSEDPKSAPPKTTDSRARSQPSTPSSTSNGAPISRAVDIRRPTPPAQPSPPQPQRPAVAPAPTRPTYFPAPTYQQDEADATREDRPYDEPPPLLDDFQIEPVAPFPSESIPTDDTPPNGMPPPANGDALPPNSVPNPADVGQ